MTQHFFSIYDLPDPSSAINQAIQLKQNPKAYRHFGQDRTLGLIFLNPSLRTRLSSQRAAQNLGMNTFVLNVNQDGWKLEYADGTVMDSDAGEHVKEAAQVLAQYCDVIGLRCFPGLVDRDDDYQENILTKFAEYCGKPVISLESATGHPLQALADAVTIEEYKSKPRPKVVLSWAPHIKPLPQSVANSFAETMLYQDYELVITHPEGYELKDSFTAGAQIEYNQEKALTVADFVYVKNWSSYHHYGKLLPTKSSWMMTREKMERTNQAYFMHCLPIRRNLVAEDAVVDHPRSLVIQQAENRIFAMQSVLMNCLTDE
jgi:N-succinyl-L-ornithine transcarbamylase